MEVGIGVAFISVRAEVSGRVPKAFRKSAMESKHTVVLTFICLIYFSISMYYFYNERNLYQVKNFILKANSQSIGGQGDPLRI